LFPILAFYEDPLRIYLPFIASIFLPSVKRKNSKKDTKDWDMNYLTILMYWGFNNNSGKLK